MSAADSILLHRCGPSCGPDCAEAVRGAIARRDRQHVTIDFHCHAIVPAVEALVADRPEKKAEQDRQGREMGAASVEHNRRVMLPAAGPRLTSPLRRLQDMDEMGVDIQVVSPSPSQYYYWAEERLAERIVRTGNEAIAALCAEHPDRLQGLGSVALQHPALAVEQLDHAVRGLGLRGVEISTRIVERELDHADFEPFWAKAEALGCVIFIHPFGTTLGERLDRFYLSNVIGQPLETTIALSHLIFGGVLDRFPGLRIVAAHGGGYLPHYTGRSDHGRRVRPEAAGCAHPPSAYLKRIWFDTLVHGPDVLRGLIDRVGASQLVVGTDYPFDMGAYDVHALVDAVPGLSAEDRAAILGGNAASLLAFAPVKGRSGLKDTQR